MAKELPEHKDILGRILKVGDCVAYPDGNSMRIGKIDKLNAKMIRIATGTLHKYPKDTIKLEGPDLTLYFLTK